ncbi:Hsp70 family protein [uncultured Ruegeria sp.]|uniref:Hsp70 family protein n=1 Tax=uncultured Ruegeria sp. TaxID=259304 RepID=UPI0026282FA4|nr:Hsp70 family protein [uncultured Ruegeria sp.]
MASYGPVLGIDFGTSNSAAGYLVDGSPQLVEVEPGQQTLPTTFFFDFESRKTLMGEPANAALLNGAEGRFMRALKRVLGTSLMHEKRQILNERVTFVDVISRFLARIKAQAEAQAGCAIDRVLSGRPVVFHGMGDTRENQAEADLRSCYLAAGFKQVDFMPEPVAAAISSGALDRPDQIGLIVDIGGGTSDFSLFRSNDDQIGILANHGVRIGGTDFDRSISVDQVMPLLGKGTELRKVIGGGTTPTPVAIFSDLATWEKIPFLYTAQNRRLADEMARLAQEPEKLTRLATVLRDELGHDMAFAVEQGKIAANTQKANAAILLDQIERNLSVPVRMEDLDSILTPHARTLSDGVAETLRLAGLAADQVDCVVYVGGSSLMSTVTDTMKAVFPNAQHRFSEVFTAVADGLAIAANRP